ncbi:MAG: membrane protein insertion efficiency factor YidD [Solirubrobacteraceae bacterium]
MSSSASHGAPPLHGVVRFARMVAVTPIVVYQRFISPAIPRRCKYEPTCSRYAVDAIREYGILRGLVLAGWRLLRCNPWSHGGYDPVEAQRVFRIGSPARSPDNAG